MSTLKETEDRKRLIEAARQFERMERQATLPMDVI